MKQQNSNDKAKESVYRHKNVFYGKLSDIAFGIWYLYSETTFFSFNSSEKFDNHLRNRRIKKKVVVLFRPQEDKVKKQNKK